MDALRFAVITLTIITSLIGFFIDNNTTIAYIVALFIAVVMVISLHYFFLYFLGCLLKTLT